MKYLKSIYEHMGERKMVLSLKNNKERQIKFDVIDGRIKNIENPGHLPFPYKENQPYNRGMETWCCNNGYYMDDKDTCPEPKIFGIKTSDVPKGHEWRTIFKNKFK